MNKLPFDVRGGTTIGKDHVIAGHNRQDWFLSGKVTIRDQEYIIALVSDGCGMQRLSEVGGSLLPIFGFNQIVQLLEIDKRLEQIPELLYFSTVAYLDALRKIIPFRTTRDAFAFIRTALLATLAGYIISESKTLIFHAGRSRFLVNEEVILIEPGEFDPYPAYQILPKEEQPEAESIIDYNFEHRILETSAINTIAVTTDGFNQELLERLGKEVFPGETGVQRWLNYINGPRNNNVQRGVFLDDATVVISDRQK